MGIGKSKSIKKFLSLLWEQMILIAVAFVLMAGIIVLLGFMYHGNTQKDADRNSSSYAVLQTTVVSKMLIVITVSENDIFCNGTILPDTESLKKILLSEDKGDIAISLIDDNANPEVFEQVNSLLSELGI